MSARGIVFIGSESSIHVRDESCAAFKELHASLSRSLLIHKMKLAQESPGLALNSVDDDDPWIRR